MNTYKEMYDQHLDGLAETPTHPYSFLLERADPIGYQCGFGDYAGGGSEFACSNCDNSFVPGDDGYSPDMGDPVLCPACRGEENS